MKGLNLHTERCHWVLGKIDQQQSRLRCILIMLSDFRDKDKDPQGFQAKNQITYKAKELDWHWMSQKQYIEQGNDGAAFSKKV